MSHLFLGFEWYNKHGFRSKLPLGNLVGRETMELKDALTINGEMPIMLISLKDKLDDPSIRELVGYAVFPDPEQVRLAMESYAADNRHLMGLSLDGEVIGVLGYETLPDGVVRICHIAVDPEFREMGYGRGMLLELIDLIKPAAIVAETDDDAVDFYRNIGFEIVSLGEKFPGVERYMCTFVTDFHPSHEDSE